MKRKELIINILISFILIFLICWINNPNFDASKLYYDTKNYLELSDSFMVNGSFSLTNYPMVIRGYLWPLILYIIRFKFLFESNLIGMYIFLSLYYSIVFNVIALQLFELIFKKKMPKFSGIVLTLLVIIYFPGLLMYPLTDLFGLSLLMLTVIFAIKFINSKDNIWFACLSGLFAYCYYNTRSSIALIPIMIVLIYVLFNINKQYIIKFILCFLCGIFIIGAPQAYINYNHGNGLDIKLHSDNYAGRNDNLITFQLYLGTSYIRYDTLVEEASKEQNSNTIIEYSDAGSYFLAENKIFGYESIGEYLSYVLKNPKTFLIIYLEHLKSLANVSYGEIYIKSLNPKPLIKYSNYLLILVTIITLFTKIKKINFNKNTFNIFILVLAMIIPSFVTIVGVPELRFFFPVYMMMYLTLILNHDLYYKKICDTIKMLKSKKVL